MERILELERYKRRWNLWIRGLKEKEGEDIRDAVADLLVKISPSWSSNINQIEHSVHRIGRHEENKTRHVIIQFIQRLHRDALWRMTKDHAICKELCISFIEDLCKADRETRAALWPKIKEARDAGKRAYYRSGAGHINGRRITWEHTRYMIKGLVFKVWKGLLTWTLKSKICLDGLFPLLPNVGTMPVWAFFVDYLQN